MELSGGTAVVTGAAGGLGLAMARRFAAEGMAVVMADIDEGLLASEVDALGRTGANVLGVPTDVTDAESVRTLAAAAADAFGDVDLVCNNAGVAPMGGVLEMSVEQFRWVADVNLWGVLHGVQAFLPDMIERDAGHIVNTASASGLLTQPGAAAYNISKFGVVALTEALYYELQMIGSSVGLSVLCPATVRTRIFDADRFRPGELGPIGARAKAVMEQLAAAARRGPDDIAAAVVDAVRENRFYVITHRGILPFVHQRHEDIEQQRNPSVEQGF